MPKTQTQPSSTPTQADYDGLEKSYITPAIADAAGIYRVDSHEGATIVSVRPKRGEDYSGLIFPYRMPEDTADRILRLRRDHPTLEQKSDGTVKETRKYLSSVYDRNDFYFSPQAKAAWLQDVAVPVVFVEGEKKCLALQRLFVERGEKALVIGIPGVWNWRGRNGKTTNNAGKSQATTGSILDFDRVEWKGRQVEIVFDADTGQNSHVAGAQKALAKYLRTLGATVRVLEMPPLAQTNCKGIDDLLGAKGADFVSDWLIKARPAADDAANAIGKYFIAPDGMRWNKPLDGGSVTVLLCNFIAEITGDISEDDGAEIRRCYEVSARLAGETSDRKGIIPCTEFATLRWRDELLGARAIIHPGRERHVECAIREHSYDIETRSIIAHTGWRNDGAGWLYYHNEGAIGARGNIAAEVSLPPQLAAFSLPAVPAASHRSAAIAAITSLLTVAPDEIIVPLVGSVFAAILGKCDFSLHLSGYTGSGKTAIASLVQSFFGAGFADGSHIPASWSSTANANEGLAHTAKDAVLLVDDFCPTGSPSDIARLHGAADRLIRAQGNTSGRGRMRADGSLRPTKPPRGLILSTGEDIPRGQSLRARSLILELSQGVTNWQAVTEAQRLARGGALAQATSAFLQWLATNDRLTAIQAEQQQEHSIAHWRAAWLTRLADGHKRSATTLAALSRAWYVWLEFTVAAQAETEATAKAMWQRAWQALGAAGGRQAAYQASENPASRFVELLQSAFSSGKAYLDLVEESAGLELSPYGWRGGQPQGERVGWLDGEGLYLIPDAAFTIAQRAGEGLNVTPATLWKRLKGAGSLAAYEGERTTIRKRIAGKDFRLISLKTEIFSA